MVNFRFHLVSLTAVFLALAVGIGLGATVVDQATVDFLKSRLAGVETRLDGTDRQNEQLRGELGRWSRFAEQASVEAVSERLSGVPVLVLAVQGMERGPVDELRQTLTAAGAHLVGTVWFTSRLTLHKPEDVAALAAIVETPPRAPEAVRRAALARIVDELAPGPPSGLLGALRAAAFVDVEGPAGGPPELAPVAGAETRFVVVSDARAAVPNHDLAIPLAGQLARSAGSRVLAAEPGRDPAEGQPGERALFVGPLREDGASAAVISTVDNLEDFRGRFAAVYALRDLGKGKVGHFGVGPRATRMVPETAS